VTIKHTVFSIDTKGKGLYPFTGEIEKWLQNRAIQNGTLTLFAQHTSCSLVIQENADPDVTLDMRDFFERLVPEETRGYRHTQEGPDDMTSHIRSALTGTSLTIPIIDGHMALGTWQGVYLFEHRRVPHRRNVVAQVMGV
jgi:secondary thiamine-phosphate synthase enzyme